MLQILTVTLLIVGVAVASGGSGAGGAPPSPGGLSSLATSPPVKVPMVLAPIPPAIIQQLIPELQKDPAIEGVLSCEKGSQGALVGLRLHGEAGKCESVPCDVAVDNLYILEADFFTAASHPNLNVKLSVLLLGKPELVLIEQTATVINNQKVQAKSGYTLGFPIKAPSQLLLLQLLSGGTLNVKLEASEYGITELCGVLPIRVVE